MPAEDEKGRPALQIENCFVYSWFNSEKMRRLRAFIRNFKLTLKMKLVLSLSSIAVILLVSSFISIMEYSRMSNYVSDLIAANIGSINASQRLANASNAYNLAILAVIGDKSSGRLPELRQEEFLAHCDSLRALFLFRSCWFSPAISLMDRFSSPRASSPSKWHVYLSSVYF